MVIQTYLSDITLLGMTTFHPSRTSIEMGRMRCPEWYVLIVTSTKDRIDSPLS